MARLASLNIERSRHLDRVIPFLRDLRPDVVCLQELVQRDIAMIQSGAGLSHVHYVQMAVHPVDGQAFGVAILAREPIEAADSLVYHGAGDGTQMFDRSTDETKVATCRYVVARARLGGAGTGVTVATTHFPWTPDGEPRAFQLEAAARLAGMLTGPVVLTGDFNAPRGGPVFARLAQVWRDCIPADVKTSIDPELHRAGPLQLMVDGLFVTPSYCADDVRLHTGLSDHQGITAEIARRRE